MKEFEMADNGAHAVKGNHIIHDQYRDLELPWQVDPPVSAFPQEKFIRKEWDYDDDFDDRDDFLGGSKHVTIKQIEAVLATSSQFISWRRTHPNVAGTDEDILVRSMKILREAAGMGPDENGSLPLGTSLTLLLFRKL